MSFEFRRTLQKKKKKSYEEFIAKINKQKNKKKRNHSLQISGCKQTHSQ